MPIEVEKVASRLVRLGQAELSDPERDIKYL